MAKKKGFNLNKKTIILVIAAIVIVGILAATGIIDLKPIIDEIKHFGSDVVSEIIPSGSPDDETDPTPTGTESGKKPTNTPTAKPEKTPTNKPTDKPEQQKVSYYFRNSSLLNQHYDKHGKDMGFKDAKSYEKAASDVINNPAALHKTEKEDGDFVYYIVATNEFVVLSKDGYIRTYFLPDAGKAYYDRQ